MIIDTTLKGIRCDRVILSADKITSCADAIAKVLESELNGQSS
jgi:hypothetical protein